MSESFITDSTPAGDSEKITVSSIAVGFTSSKILTHQAGGDHKRAVKAFVTVETNPIRIQYDGTNPDSTTGHSFIAGSSFTIQGEQNISRLRMIRTGSDATVQVTYIYNR